MGQKFLVKGGWEVDWREEDRHAGGHVQRGRGDYTTVYFLQHNIESERGDTQQECFKPV